jgi:hypothetical protein
LIYLNNFVLNNIKMKKLIAAIILGAFVMIGISSCSSRQGCPGVADSYKFRGNNRGVWR